MKKCFAVKDVVMMLQVLAQCVMLRVVVIYKYYIQAYIGDIVFDEQYF